MFKYPVLIILKIIMVCETHKI